MSWDYIEEILLSLRLPEKFIKWVMTYVRTPVYSIMINGNPEGFFKGACGIRQGVPMSSLMFVLVMEYPSRSLKQVEDKEFDFHSGCKKLRINHMCFADGLFIICKANLKSVNIIAIILGDFHKASCLGVNTNKSCVYFYGVSIENRDQLLNVWDSLKVSYL
ncbi:uncharacterized protein LOC126668294 [Mercurialis annua]|uniref:uncharacterized protein LOC126668294 n=1 Tax=Mercurialis annua TaxID=3986 RepID=UPI00215E9504|nr:uncharacterized protein LOC126668294 [Mercurialis annua]